MLLNILKNRTNNLTAIQRCPEIEYCHTRENCALITFEGGGSLTPIPDVNVGFTIVQFPNWITTIDSDAGGVAQTANEPSPETTAAFVGTPNFRDILFTNPVSSVSLFYTSVQAVTIEAYDENNTLLGSDSGNANAGTGTNPPDDPGFFNRFDELSINIGTNSIVRLRVFAKENDSAFDNLTACVEVRGLITED
jgi:hypothetical protein